MSRRARPVLVYDGDCGFCTSCVHLLEALGCDAEIVPWQLADLDALGLDEQQAREAVQFVDVDGSVRAGHVAIAHALCAAGTAGRALGRLILLPVISSIAAKVYRLVAENRHRLPGGSPACAPKR